MRKLIVPTHYLNTRRPDKMRHELHPNVGHNLTSEGAVYETFI